MNGRGRIRSVGGHFVEALRADWRACRVAPGAAEDPDALARTAPRWIPTTAPTTVAATLRHAGEWSLDGAERRFDAEEWWFGTRFAGGDAAPERVLCLDGLATVADVWLNGERLLSSTSMFQAHELQVGAKLGADNELWLRFRPLDGALSARRPRPRWRAPMIEHQQLRWLRTTLLGRTPGWSPPAAAVGPWREVRLERRSAVAVEDVRLRTSLDGARARLAVSCALRVLDARVLGVHVELERQGRVHRAVVERRSERGYAGALELDEVARWWPHTHGDAALYACRLVVECGLAAPVIVDLGAVGFREVSRSGDFALRVNDVPIFCRGACWTPLDAVTLAGADADAYRRALSQARDAGMNMLRVGGTMVYERDEFYDRADELGVLLWHDFMFANMDYPDEDAGFVEGVELEASQWLARMQGRPSLAVLCGNSEVEQQAAMWGADRARWRPRLFHEVLRTAAADACGDVPYWPSSAHGGAFPHDARAGTTSYYGVGAYLRPLEDARRSELRFATECLAFANLPAEGAMPGGPGARVHHPAWKARTPRDLGAGWDFDDVRDHYLRELFRVDPPTLRYADPERYAALGRVVTGEVMARAMGEWRRARSTCGGALVWLLRDLWTSCGWGVVDAQGAPKAAYHYLRRALQPVSVHLSDEGANGLGVHLINEREAPLIGELELSLHRAGEVSVARATRAVTIAPRAAIELAASDLFEGLYDLTYAYRFGPPACDLVVATLRSEQGSAEAFFFPLGLPSGRELELGLTASARVLGDVVREGCDGGGGDVELRVETRRFAQSVSIQVEGFAPDDDFFHLAPGRARTVRLRRQSAKAAPRGVVQALNAEGTTKIVVAS